MEFMSTRKPKRRGAAPQGGRGHPCPVHRQWPAAGGKSSVVDVHSKEVYRPPVTDRGIPTRFESAGRPGRIRATRERASIVTGVRWARVTSPSRTEHRTSSRSPKAGPIPGTLPRRPTSHRGSAESSLSVKPPHRLERIWESVLPCQNSPSANRIFGKSVIRLRRLSPIWISLTASRTWRASSWPRGVRLSSPLR
jgi:hypothetical protein